MGSFNVSLLPRPALAIFAAIEKRAAEWRFLARLPLDGQQAIVIGDARIATRGYRAYVPFGRQEVLIDMSPRWGWARVIGTRTLHP